MPRVLIVSPVTDVAGVGIGLKHAFDAVGGEWQARHVRGGPEWLEYPHDAEWDQLEELWEWADVVHVMELPRHVAHLPSKPAVVQHNGTRYRRHPKSMSAACQRLPAIEVAGSIDLCRLGRLPWLPIPLDLDAVSRHAGPPTGAVRVSHAPTNRDLKSTELVLDVLHRLGVEVELIEGVPWAECLARKATSHIYVDELTLGYGMNAIECWAMGIPVVSGIADPRFRRAAVQAWGGLPFVEATVDTLEAVVRQLVESPEARGRAAELGCRHAAQFHSQHAVVSLATRYYARATGVWKRRTRLRTPRGRSTTSYELNSAAGP